MANSITYGDKSDIYFAEVFIQVETHRSTC